MPTSNNRNHKTSDWGVMEMARERPIAAAAAAAGAAAAGLFLWSKRSEISHQINSLSDQIGEWTESMTSGTTPSPSKGTATRTTRRANMRSGTSARSSSATGKTGKRGRKTTSSRARTSRKTTGTGAPQGTGSSGPLSDNG